MLRTRGVSDHRLLLPVTYPSFCSVRRMRRTAGRERPVSAARSASDGLGVLLVEGRQHSKSTLDALNVIAIVLAHGMAFHLRVCPIGAFEG